MRRTWTLSVGIACALLMAACAPAATPAPTAVPPTAAMATQAPAAAPTSTVPAPTATEVPMPTPVATIPADQLSQKGKLLICTDFPYPPQEFYDANGTPQGMDIEIGNEIAARLGLQVQYVNSVFDTIIAAVKGGKCDIIISAQTITADRHKQVSMIPYFQAGQAFVAAKGNPDNINGPMDLCGKSAAAESGTTEADHIQGTGDYQGDGLSAACVAAGKPPINLVVTSKDTDALQQLQAGKVSVYFADSPVAAYYTIQHPDQFQLAGNVQEPAAEGISVPCGQADCTSAPLSAVGQAVQTALQSMMADGTYDQILTKWNLESGSVKGQ